MDLPTLATKVERALELFNFDFRTASGQTMAQAGITTKFSFRDIKRVGTEQAEISIRFRVNKQKITTADKSDPNLKIAYYWHTDVLAFVAELTKALHNRKLVEDQPVLFQTSDADLSDGNWWSVAVNFSTTLKV